MKDLLILLLLVFVILVSGCMDQDVPIVGATTDGVVIRYFSFDSSTVYAGDRVGLNLEVQNTGEEPATIVSATLFGPGWATGNPTPDITGRLEPSEPELDFEGEARYTRWRLTTPIDVRTGTTYSVGTRVVYNYKTVYVGTIRVVEEDYLETLPEGERESLFESSGVISGSATGGPLSVSPVKGRSFVVNGVSGMRPIQFKVSNVGSGYTYTGDIDTGNYKILVSSPSYSTYLDCGQDEEIKLSKGKSRIFNCNFTIPSNVVNRIDVPFSMTFSYSYYIDGIASITVEPTGEEITTTSITPQPSCSGFVTMNCAGFLTQMTCTGPCCYWDTSGAVPVCGKNDCVDLDESVCEDPCGCTWS